MVSLAKKTLFLSLLILLISPSIMCSEELPNKYKNLKAMRNRLQTREDVIERRWENIIKTVKSEDLSQEKKIAIVQKFVDEFPTKNKHLEEAEEILSKLKISGDDAKKYLEGKKYRTKTEWFALSFFGGSYGLGGSFTLVTLRWRYFFWEVYRVQATGASFFKDEMAGFSANQKTMVGIPIFLDKTYRHEIRISTGLSGGLTIKWKKELMEAGDLYFVDNAFLNLPFDVSYVFHVKENFSFQVGASLDLPIVFENFYPVVNGFVGFRI